MSTKLTNKQMKTAETSSEESSDTSTSSESSDSIKKPIKKPTKSVTKQPVKKTKQYETDSDSDSDSSEKKTVKPVASKKQLIKTTSDKSVVAKPAKPVITKPAKHVVAKPAKPVVAKPVVTKPVVAKSVVTKSVMTKFVTKPTMKKSKPVENDSDSNSSSSSSSSVSVKSLAKPVAKAVLKTTKPVVSKSDSDTSGKNQIKKTTKIAESAAKVPTAVEVPKSVEVPKATKANSSTEAAPESAAPEINDDSENKSSDIMSKSVADISELLKRDKGVAKKLTDEAWRKRFREEGLVIITPQTTPMMWMKEYTKITEAKQEAEVIIKTGLAISSYETIIDFNLDSFTFPAGLCDIPENHTGDCEIMCSKQNITNLKVCVSNNLQCWTCVWKPDTDDDTHNMICYDEIVKIITVICYYNVHHSTNIELVTRTDDLAGDSSFDLRGDSHVVYAARKMLQFI